MKIRLLSIVLALAIFTTCFAGCGKRENVKKVTSSGSQPETSSQITSSEDNNSNPSSGDASSDNTSSPDSNQGFSNNTDASSDNTSSPDSNQGFSNNTDDSSDFFEPLPDDRNDSSAQNQGGESSNGASSETDSSLPAENSGAANDKAEDDGNPNDAKYSKSKRINLLNSKGEFEYSIIYPEGMATDQLSIARRVYRAANKISENIPVYNSDDRIAAKSSSKEILIGLTNRSQSEVMRKKLKNNRANNFYDFIIAVSKNKIIIDADSTDVLEEAITFFIDTFLAEEAEHTIPEDYLFIRAETAETAMKIAGKDVSNYVIVCEETPSYMVYKSLEELQEAIKEKTDYVVPIVKTNNTSKYKDKLIATVTGKNTNAYSVSFDGTNIVMKGGHNSSLSAAIHALAANIKQVSSGSAFNIPKTFSYKSTYSKKSPTTEGYHLVFADEFNGNSYDSKNWHTQQYWSNLGENQSDYFKSTGKLHKNVSVADGSLQIKSTIEEQEDGLHSRGGGFESNFYLQFGIVEIRAKQPHGPGIWTSFWLNSKQTLEKKYGGEIDVFEFFGADMKATSNLHSWWNAGRTVLGHTASDSDIARGHTQHLGKDDGNYYSLPSGESFADGYHTYTLEWTPKVIKFAIDGYNYCSQSLTSFLTHPEYGYPINEFMFFLNKSANIRFGNGLGASSVTKEEDYPKLKPDTYYIDYVHVYQMDGVGSFGEIF